MGVEEPEEVAFLGIPCPELLELPVSVLLTGVQVALDLRRVEKTGASSSELQDPARRQEWRVMCLDELCLGTEVRQSITASLARA